MPPPAQSTEEILKLNFQIIDIMIGALNKHVRFVQLTGLDSSMRLGLRRANSSTTSSGVSGMSRW